MKNIQNVLQLQSRKQSSSMILESQHKQSKKIHVPVHIQSDNSRLKTRSV